MDNGMDYATRLLREPVDAPNDAMIVYHVLIAQERLKKRSQEGYQRQDAQDEGENPQAALT
jgi:hypothetical protein